MVDYVQQSTPIIIDSVILKSEKLNFSMDIFPAVADIQVFESILKPYLTGRISFVDAEDVVNRIGYAGDEYIIVSLKRYNSDLPPLKKKFYLDSILTSKKLQGANSTELFVFHLTEDTLYESSMVNISKSYRGSVLKIIDSIVLEYINSNFIPLNEQEELDDDMKVIIPNLSPMDAIMWLKKRALDIDGMPYLMYTTFSGGRNIYCASLKQMFQEQPFNAGRPFKNYQSSVQYNDFQGTSAPILNDQFQIINYEINETDNLYKLIREGMVGSNFNYYDVVNGENNIIKLNAEKLLAELYDKVGLQDVSLYPYGSTIENSRIGKQSLSEVANLRNFNYPSIKPYETGFSNTKSFLGENVNDQYAKRIVALTVLKYLEKHKMNITISGDAFLNNPSLSTTVGNKIELEFLMPDQVSSGRKPIDFKKSGEYLISKAVHNISKDSYTLNLEVCKVKDTKIQTSASGGQSASEVSEEFNKLGIFTGNFVA